MNQKKAGTHYRPLEHNIALYYDPYWVALGFAQGRPCRPLPTGGSLIKTSIYETHWRLANRMYIHSPFDTMVGRPGVAVKVKTANCQNSELT
jgi:hypothetical protein